MLSFKVNCFEPNYEPISLKTAYFIFEINSIYNWSSFYEFDSYFKLYSRFYIKMPYETIFVSISLKVLFTVLISLLICSETYERTPFT